MAEHSRFGGSSIGRVIECTGSPALLDTVPATTSTYADEGTLAHDFAAYMLANGDRDASSYIGSTLDATVGAKPLTEEMAIAIQVYLNAVWAEFDRTPDAEIFVERSFTLEIETAKTGEVHGRNDCIIWHPSIGRMRAFDYKHGAGVFVEVEDSPQLKFYAAGAAFSNPWPIKELILTIVQPRAWNAEEAVRDWPMDVLELLEFKQQVTKVVAEALTGGTLRAGWWCDKSFCDGRVSCPAYQALKLAGTGFENVSIVDLPELPPVHELTDERLAAIVAGLQGLTTWFNAAQERLEARLLGGHDVPGWKVVEKIGRAKWISDEEVIADTLGALYGIDENLIRPRRLATITEAEKLMKGAGATKAEIDSFKLANTLKESSGNTIAPESDRRLAVNVAERAFGNVQA